MKLRITEIEWDVDPETCEYSEKVTGEILVPCEIGLIPEFGVGKYRFEIDQVYDDAICLFGRDFTLARVRDFDITLGNKMLFRPVLIDFDHNYEFELIAEA